MGLFTKKAEGMDQDELLVKLLNAEEYGSAAIDSVDDCMCCPRSGEIIVALVEALRDIHTFYGTVGHYSETKRAFADLGDKLNGIL